MEILIRSFGVGAVGVASVGAYGVRLPKAEIVFALGPFYTGSNFELGLINARFCEIQIRGAFYAGSNFELGFEVIKPKSAF